MVMASALLCAGLAVAGDDAGHGPPPIQDARFDFLKSLAGTWIAEGSQPGSPGGTFEFRVTAGGHAVEEREMIGTPMEMVTLYHMDGRDLVGTHYCMLGNRPRVTAAPRVVDESLAFSCSGKPGGAGSHDEEHVHGWTLRRDGDGRVHYTAQLVRQGRVTEAPSMVLTRPTETSNR
jgi:hypothetical protein